MVRCPRCGYEFDLKRTNKLRQVIEYLEVHNGVKVRDLHRHFNEKWTCQSNIVTNVLRKLGRDRVIKVINDRVYITDEWVLRQKRITGRPSN